MRLLRGVVLAAGLAVVSLLGMTEWFLRRRDRVQPASSADVGEGSATPLPGVLPRLRLAVGAVGVAVAGYGVVVLLGTVPWTSYLGLAVWLLAAVVLHDAVLVPAVSALRAAAHRAGRRLPGAAVALVEAGFVVGGVLSLIALPEIWAQRLGPLNPTVLPGAYGPALVTTWLVVAILAAAGVAIIVVRSRRPADRRPR